ncbi:hypothetical protein [Rhodococcus koreensis]
MAPQRTTPTAPKRRRLNAAQRKLLRPLMLTLPVTGELCGYPLRTAREMARNGTFPIPIVVTRTAPGRRPMYRVRREDVIAFLGITAEDLDD